MPKTQNVLPVGDWLIGYIMNTSVSIGTTPTLLPATAQTNRRLVIVYNNSGATVYLGGSDVTPGTGMPLANATSFSINLDEKALLYGIEATGSREVRVMEVC